MKRLIHVCVIAVLGTALASFTLINNTLTLEQALAEKKVTIQILPYGETGRVGIRLDVTNVSGKSLKLNMTRGTTFVPDNSEEQTLVTSEDQIFALSGGQKKQITQKGFCTELQDHGSAEESTFQLSRATNDRLLNIINFMDSLKVKDNSLIQQSVWCITNNRPAAYVQGTDTAQARHVREHLCSLTGQPIPWYATESNIVITPAREYVVEPQVITGELSFHSTTPVAMQGCVKDSAGNVITTNPNILRTPAGKITFDYKLTVRNWEKGKYSVVYTNNGVEVINQPFEI